MKWLKYSAFKETSSLPSHIVKHEYTQQCERETGWICRALQRTESKQSLIKETLSV